MAKTVAVHVMLAAPAETLLNMAEIEIGILDRQCLDRRLPNCAALVTEVDAWQLRRNTEQRGIAWSFTRQDADEKMARYYVP